MLAEDVDQMDDALATAHYAHLGQERRSGGPYISHPIAVAKYIDQFYPNDSMLYKAALLHDTLEDAIDLGNVQDEEEMLALIADSASSDDEASELIDIIFMLTKPAGAGYSDYVKHMSKSPDVLKIKLADMMHNLESAPHEKQKLKYKDAIEELEKLYGGIPPEISDQHWEALKQLLDQVTNEAVRLIKTTAKEIMLMESKKKGAGVIVVKHLPEGWRILGLRTKGEYDLPKGRQDVGEDIFQTALRETAEETGLTDLEFLWGYDGIQLGHLTMYLATTVQDPYIPQNPKSGIYEHEAADWLEWDQLLKEVYPYLRPGIIWAQQKIRGTN